MFEEEYRNRINRVVALIERDLDSPLTLDMLAREAGISPFHLHRLFSIYTGETVSGFIRRIRLSTAFQKLKKGKTPSVLEASLSVGYGSVSSFIRAFRQRFGFTPRAAAGLKASSFSIWRTQAADTENIIAQPYRIELKGPQAIVGVTERGYQDRSFQKAAERAFARALALTKSLGLEDVAGRACAVMFEDPDLDDPLSMKYFGGFEWLGKAGLSFEGLELMTIPSGTFAVFLHQGSYRSLWQSWNVAYRNWLPNSSFQLRDAFPFEIYLNDPRTVRREAELLTEIYIPVERRLG